jgi:alkaline phosphatase D
MKLESVLALLIDDLQYTNLDSRGFMEVVFTPTEALSNWHYMSNYDSQTYTINAQRAKSLKTVVNTNTLTAV